jgi:hypothetical protein
LGFAGHFARWVLGDFGNRDKACPPSLVLTSMCFASALNFGTLAHRVKPEKENRSTTSIDAWWEFDLRAIRKV